MERDEMILFGIKLTQISTGFKLLVRSQDMAVELHTDCKLALLMKMMKVFLPFPIGKLSRQMVLVLTRLMLHQPR